jgi:hypothetical protein
MDMVSLTVSEVTSSAGSTEGYVGLVAVSFLEGVRDLHKFVAKVALFRSADIVAFVKVNLVPFGFNLGEVVSTLSHCVPVENSHTRAAPQYNSANNASNEQQYTTDDRQALHLATSTELCSVDE